MYAKKTVHFLKISGEIASNKEKEFKQTVQFVFNQLPAECIEHNLSGDVHNGSSFFVSFRWSNETSLLKFMRSADYQLITGAFTVLGRLAKSEHGEIV